MIPWRAIVSLFLSLCSLCGMILIIYFCYQGYKMFTDEEPPAATFSGTGTIKDPYIVTSDHKDEIKDIYPEPSLDESDFNWFIPDSSMDDFMTRIRELGATWDYLKDSDIYKVFAHNEFDIKIENNRIVSMITTCDPCNEPIPTARGIKRNDSFQDVVNAYGENYTMVITQTGLTHHDIKLFYTFERNGQLYEFGVTGRDHGLFREEIDWGGDHLGYVFISPTPYEDYMVDWIYFELVR